MRTAANLKQLIGEAGITSAAVAERLGLSESALSMKLSGKRPIRLEEARALTEILNEPPALRSLGRRRAFSLDELFGRAA